MDYNKPVKPFLAQLNRATNIRLQSTPDTAPASLVVTLISTHGRPP